MRNLGSYQMFSLAFRFSRIYELFAHTSVPLCNVRYRDHFGSRAPTHPTRPPERIVTSRTGGGIPEAYSTRNLGI